MAPEMMKAALYYGAHDIRVEDVKVPNPSKGQVRVKVAFCGICGSDLHEFEAGPIFAPTATVPNKATGEVLPICMGHEFSGTIDHLGEGVTGGWKLGDRVVVEPVISCGECFACSKGWNNACTNLGFIGLSGGVDGGSGGLSSYVCAPESYLHALPANVSLEAGAMVEPLAVAMHSVEASGIKAGMSALVLGTGPIGCFVIKTLIAMGVSTIIASELSPIRREKAQLAGANHVLSPQDVDIVTQCQKLTEERGVDCSFECAGVQPTLLTGIAALRTKGVCINVAIWSITPKIDMNALLLGEKTLRGVICYKNNHQPAIECLSSGKITLDGFVTAVISLNDVVKKGFLELLHHNEDHVKILVKPTLDGN